MGKIFTPHPKTKKWFADVKGHIHVSMKRLSTIKCSPAKQLASILQVIYSIYIASAAWRLCSVISFKRTSNNSVLLIICNATSSFILSRYPMRTRGDNPTRRIQSFHTSLSISLPPSPPQRMSISCAMCRTPISQRVIILFINFATRSALINIRPPSPGVQSGTAAVLDTPSDSHEKHYSRGQCPKPHLLRTRGARSPCTGNGGNPTTPPFYGDVCWVGGCEGGGAVGKTRARTCRSRVRGVPMGISVFLLWRQRMRRPDFRGGTQDVGPP